MTTTIDLPSRIKAARKNAGFKTAKSFIETKEFPHSTYVQYETGRRMPNDEVLKKLCKLFKVNFDWLKYGHGTPLKNGKSSGVIDGELLDVKAEASRPVGINEELLTKILEKLLPLAEKEKLSIKKVSQAAGSIYSDITQCEPDPELQAKMIMPAIAMFKRYAV